LDNDSLKSFCDNLEAALNDDRKSGIDANTLVSNMLAKISENLKFGDDYPTKTLVPNKA
jgi:hypothetical protein